MLTLAELKKLRRTPKINDISLELLREYYEIYLNPFIYHYKLEDSINNKCSIEVRFDKERFCHLLGIETIVKKQVNCYEIKNYKGLRGWNNIESGHLNFQSLKNMNKKAFENGKAKFIYFYLLPNLLKTPNAVNYDKSKVSSGTNIDCKIMFYDTYNNAILHLGIEPNDAGTYYFPRTLLIEKINPKNSGTKFVINQQPIGASMTHRVILL